MTPRLFRQLPHVRIPGMVPVEESLTACHHQWHVMDPDQTYSPDELQSSDARVLCRLERPQRYELPLRFLSFWCPIGAPSAQDDTTIGRGACE